MKFQYECCRCGFCCIAIQCPISIRIYGLQSICPALSFDNSIAICEHAGILVPIGDGCCIKARAFKDGSEYDFASLPIEMKLRVAQDTLNKKKD